MVLHQKNGITPMQGSHRRNHILKKTPRRWAWPSAAGHGMHAMRPRRVFLTAPWDGT